MTKELIERLTSALATAESFMAGFEGDEMQDGIDAMLEEVRSARGAGETWTLNDAKPLPPVHTHKGCGGVIQYDAWVDSNEDCIASFDNAICQRCDEEVGFRGIDKTGHDPHPEADDETAEG